MFNWTLHLLFLLQCFGLLSFLPVGHTREMLVGKKINKEWLDFTDINLSRSGFEELALWEITTQI